LAKVIEKVAPLKRYVCAIESIEYFNHDTRRVLLTLPVDANVDFKAGQYLNVVLPDKLCPFSIASPPSLKGKIELHIKPTPDSEDSVQIEQLLDNAKSLEIELPQGDCFVETAPHRTLILMAASTGITQMKSIIEHLAVNKLSHPIYLYWGVIADEDLYLSELCNTWEATDEHFHFIPVVSEPSTSPDWQGRTGLVPDAVLEDFSDLEDVSVIVGGSPGMVYATLDRFVASGMPAKNMASDVFSYAPRK
jgi:CDP-4-dehydro-6-deoxyglucose reductase